MRTIRHLIMGYHYHMAKFYDLKFKKHCRKFNRLFEKNNGTL